MNIRTTGFGASLIVLALMGSVTGCAVSRGQSSVGEYIDDTTITTAVKAKFVGNDKVDAASIKVETLEGTVQLSGFAKNASERSAAEEIARNTKGVKSVKNSIIVRS